MTGPVAGVMHLLHGFVSGAGFAMEQDVASFALHALWQVPLLACAAALAVRIGRPHVRVAHALWVTTLALCVLVPFVSTVVAQRAAVVSARAALMDAETDGVTVAFGESQPLQRESAWKLAFRRHVLSPTPFAFTLSPRVARCITLVYALIALGFGARLFFSWRRTRLLVLAANAGLLPPAIAQALRRQCDAIGCDAPPAALTDDLAGPALAGVLRPTLLMPSASVAEMSGPEIEAILAHELAHLRRRDPVSHAACSLLLLPVCFHPAALWTARRVRQTREMACDAEASERLGSARDYARALLQVAERSEGVNGAGVGLGLLGLGFFGLGLFDSDIRPRGGYRAAVRGGRLQHGRRPATAGLPLFGVAGAMEERMQTMLNSNPPETSVKRTARAVAAAGLAAVAVMAAAMVQVQPALAHAQDAAVAHTAETQDDSSPRLVGADDARQQLQHARRQLDDARPTVDLNSNRLNDLEVRMQMDALNDLQADPKVHLQMDALKNLKIAPQTKVNLDQLSGNINAQMNVLRATPEWQAMLEKGRTELDGLRAGTEHMRIETEKQRVDAERMRGEAQRMGSDAERMRADAEKMRMQAERMRVVANSPEFKARVEAQTEAARRLTRELIAAVARNEMPLVPSEFAAPAAPPEPGQDATKPVKIESGVMAGQILTKVQPKYPQSAKDAHISGAVVLHALIDETGKIQQLQLVSSPDKALSDSAIDAVRQWVYRPYLLNGSPTSVETNITVTFSFSGAELVRPNGAISQQERPVLLTHVDPVFPAEARQRFYTDGLVMLRVAIGATGKVDDVRAERSPDPLLSNAAIDAVKQWTFQPVVRNGVPVAANLTVRVNFSIL